MNDIITCPNCQSKMNEGDDCPECDHSNDGNECDCAYCQAMADGCRDDAWWDAYLSGPQRD